jgi:hypothetical protein
LCWLKTTTVGKKTAAGFLRIPPHRGLCWDENSKKTKENKSRKFSLLALVMNIF